MLRRASGLASAADGKRPGLKVAGQRELFRRRQKISLRLAGGNCQADPLLVLSYRPEFPKADVVGTCFVASGDTTLSAVRESEGNGLSPSFHATQEIARRNLAPNQHDWKRDQPERKRATRHPHPPNHARLAVRQRYKNEGVG